MTGVPISDLPTPGVIGIVPHLFRVQAAGLARALISSLEQRGLTVRVPLSDAVKVGLDDWAVADDEFAPGLLLACSLGGDGTMLRTVELVAAHDVPVLGVNVGNLGYLTVLLPEELPAALDRFLAGDYQLDERMMLAVDVVPAPGTAMPARRLYALNEAVLEKSASGHTVRLSVWINDTLFTDYSADGLIVATPTGSTAYAFSVRGPIVSPRLGAILVVPVAPHMLFDRSLVLGADESIRIEIHDWRAANLFVDGHESGRLADGTIVTCCAAEHRARLVTFGARDFHQILRAKFGLLGPPPEVGSAPAERDERDA